MNQDSATLSELLDAALDLPPQAREQWVEALAGEHAALKPRLRALLARQALIETSDFLGTLPKVELGGAEAAGDDIGPYRLIREIGVGGMGAVWLAERHDGTLKRSVALKFLRAQGPREALGERLQRERDILASLVHPNIARLYDAGVSREGLPYLALEYVEGKHIDVYCREQGLTTRARLQLLMQVARAVAYAHSKLVVHRDLKPGNILVSADAEVHLLDFGIAKLLEDGRALETRLTQMAGRALTPEYASPEQIKGEPITTASDVYSLGVILYELLAGAGPYQLKRSSRGALEDAIVEADPQKPSERAPSPAAGRALRGDLDAITIKALKKRPEERYATVSEFAADIERHLEGRPVRAQPDSSWYRLRKFIARNKLAVGASAAVLAAVLGGAAVSVWQARIAVVEKQHAEQVKDFVTSIFADASPWVGPQETPSAVELLTLARKRVAAQRELDPAIRLELMSVIGESYLGLGATEDAEQIAQQLVKQSTDQLGAEHPLTLRGRSLRAQTMRNQGKTAETRADIEAMLAVLGRNPDQQPREMVKALNDRAELELDEGRYQEAEETAHDAMALASRKRDAWEPSAWQADQALLWKVVAGSRESLASFGPASEAAALAYEHAQAAYRDQPKHPFLINIRLVFARITAYTDAPRAIAMMQQSIADSADLWGQEHRMVGLYSQNLAVWQARIGDLRGARASIERALPIIAKEMGADSAHYGAGLDAAGFIALNSRQTETARAVYEQLHALVIRHYPADSEHPTIVRMRLALARAQLGQFAAALPELRAIVGEFGAKKFPTPSRPRVALGEAERLAGNFRVALDQQLAGLATVVPGPNAGREEMALHSEIGLDYVELGKPAEAREHLERALALFAQHQVHVTPLRADVLVGLGRAQLALGERDAALDNLEQADRFWREFDPKSRWGGKAALWIGRAQAEAGRRAEAQESFRRAAELLASSPLRSDHELALLARAN